jgi:hypothetical protein
MDIVKSNIVKIIMILDVSLVNVVFTLQAQWHAIKWSKDVLDIKKEAVLIAFHHFRYKEQFAQLMVAKLLRVVNAQSALKDTTCRTTYVCYQIV